MSFAHEAFFDKNLRHATASAKHVMGSSNIVYAGADSERLFRLLRFAIVHGIFKISRGSPRQQGPALTLFANNALSACLREDHPNSQKHLVRPLLMHDPGVCGLGTVLCQASDHTQHNYIREALASTEHACNHADSSVSRTPSSWHLLSSPM